MADFSFLKQIPTRIGNFLGSAMGDAGGYGEQIRQSLQPRRRLVSPLPGGYTPGRQVSPLPEGGIASRLQETMTKGGEGEGKAKEEKKEMSQMTITTPTPEGGKVTIKMDIPVEGVLPEFQNVNPNIQQMIGGQLTEAGLGSEIANFINLAARESSLQPGVVQRAGNPFVREFGGQPADYGLYQFNEWYQRKLLEELGMAPQDLLNPENAIRAMIELFRREGYSRHPATAGPLGLLE